MKKLLLTILLCLILVGSAFGQPFAPHQKPMLGLQVNWAQPLSKGLVGCWLFNEGSGTKVFDLSGNENTIPLTNMVWRAGRYGSGIEANANGEYGTIDNTNEKVISETAGTIVLYFKSNAAFADNARHILFGSRGAGNDEGDFWIGKWDDNNFYVLFNDGSSHFVNFDSTHFPNWTSLGHQIVIQWDKSKAIFNSDNITLAVDGVYQIPDASSGETSWNAFTVDTPLGLLNDIEVTDDDADGLLEYMLIYNYVISSSGIAQFSQEPFCMFKPSWNWMLYGGISVPTVGGQVIFINMD